ncbi:MAG: hypothetical protein ACK5IJ_02420, partial [Mangrovibacterium sp.]
IGVLAFCFELHLPCVGNLKAIISAKSKNLFLFACFCEKYVLILALSNKIHSQKKGEALE